MVLNRRGMWMDVKVMLDRKTLREALKASVNEEESSGDQREDDSRW